MPITTLPNAARPSRIAALARAARIIAHGCEESGYSERKHRRLLWETAFLILEGVQAQYLPSPHAPHFSPHERTPRP